MEGRMREMEKAGKNKQERREAGKKDGRKEM